MSIQSNQLVGAELAKGDMQIVTFTVGDISLGIDIAFVQEINRHMDVTRVPGASPMIHGVVNLRGDVVTVLDPHRIFNISPKKDLSLCRNLVLRIEGERIGVLVDHVSDILTVSASQLSRRPSNIGAMDSRFIESVYVRSEEIVVILNPLKLLAATDLCVTAA